MKINFKSVRTEMDGEENIIEFNSKLEIDYEDEFKCLVFNENRKHCRVVDNPASERRISETNNVHFIFFKRFGDMFY